jgi:hypothetical protein
MGPVGRPDAAEQVRVAVTQRRSAQDRLDHPGDHRHPAGAAAEQHLDLLAGNPVLLACALQHAFDNLLCP